MSRTHELRRGLPSLKALQVFEAAARAGSFTVAAAELLVTQGAVSRQVRQLEDTLGIALFERGHRRVTLTPAGLRLQQETTEALRRIAETAAAIRQETSDLTVQVSSTLAMRWLIPRLPRFRARSPETVVRMVTLWAAGEQPGGQWDAAILYRRIGDDDLPGEKLLVDVSAPICTPRYLQASPKLARPADLAAHRLVLSTTDNWDWRHWARQFGVADLPLAQGLGLDTDHLAIEAALAGEGVAIQTLAFVQRELELGLLVCPLAGAETVFGQYRLVLADGRAGQRKLVAFRNWLFDEMAETTGRIGPGPSTSQS